nr:TolC family protein [Sedimentibacter sp.]
MKRKIAMLMTMVLLLSTLQMNFAFADDETDAAIDSVNNEAVSADDEAAENTEDTNVAENDVDETKTMKLSMDDAVKLAKESSREMWKIDDGLKEIKESRRDASKAKDTAEMIMGMSLESLSMTGMNVTSDYVSTLMAKNGYYITYADTKTKEIEKNRDLLNIGIEIETKSLYYQVLVSEKTIEVNQGNLSKAEEQLRVINLKFNNGSATKAEVLNGQMAVQSAQTDLDSSKDDLEVAKLNLLNKIDLPFDTDITLTDKELNYVPTVDINLDDALEKAKTDRPEILTAQNNLELQKIETHVYTSYYTSNLRENKSAVEKLKDAELNVPQAYKDVELDVRKSYLNLVKAERALVNMDKTVELAKESSRINKLLYENGMAASTDVLVADTNLAQAEIGRYQLLVSYNISKMMFDNSNLIGSK